MSDTPFACPAQSGFAGAGVVRLRPGRYTIESAIPGHTQAGQKATLIVTKPT